MRVLFIISVHCMQEVNAHVLYNIRIKVTIYIVYRLRNFNNLWITDFAVVAVNVYLFLQCRFLRFCGLNSQSRDQKDAFIHSHNILKAIFQSILSYILPVSVQSPSLTITLSR